MRNHKQKTTLLFILDDYSISGVTNFTRQYIDLLQTKKVNIIAMAFAHPHQVDKIYFADISTVVIPQKFSSFKILNFIYKVHSYLSYYFYLNKLLVKESVTNLHLATTRSALLCVLTPFTWNIKTSLTFYGDWQLEKISEKPHSKLEKFILGKVRFFLQKVTFRYVHKIIVFSNYSKDLIKARFGAKYSEKSVLIPPIIESDQTIKQGSKKLNKIITFLNISRFEPRKGHLELLKAVQILKNKGYLFKVVICGPMDSWYFQEVLLTYQRLDLFEYVSFLHRADQDQKKLLYEKTDFFVMPSQSLETFGLTILEALSHKLPVIGTPVGAIPETLKNIDSNLLTTSTDAQSIAKKLEWALKISDSSYHNLQKKIKTFVSSKQKQKDELRKSHIIENNFI